MKKMLLILIFIPFSQLILLDSKNLKKILSKFNKIFQ